mmetsp:Transcript_26652/g.38199  ORF Transcript_26652/g.38199 Transcript_26652/m.38199 type:complete len:100 (+) Transcript_26652:30-329(+)
MLRSRYQIIRETKTMMILARVLLLLALLTSVNSFHASYHHLQRDASPTFLKLSGGDAAVPELKVCVMMLSFLQLTRVTLPMAIRDIDILEYCLTLLYIF